MLRRMSTKVKRTPLFGHDGNLGIPIIPRDTKVMNLLSLCKKDDMTSRRKYGLPHLLTEQNDHITHYIAVCPL